jgi:hypothetical protein
VTGQKWSGQHRRLSEKLRARAIGQLCHFCGLPMLPASRSTSTTYPTAAGIGA